MEYLIFVDASFLEKLNFTSCSILIFSKNKLIDEIVASNIHYLRTSTEAELMALKIALKRMYKIMQKTEIKRIVIFTDCKSIVDVLSNPKKHRKLKKLNPNLYHYVYTINKSFLNNSNLDFKIEYISRNFNLAHKSCYKLLKKYKKSHKIRII